eukprot:scaffold823_cov86-Cylindrotheca_fusiformis.AAC.6
MYNREAQHIAMINPPPERTLRDLPTVHMKKVPSMEHRRRKFLNTTQKCHCCRRSSFSSSSATTSNRQRRSIIIPITTIIKIILGSCLLFCSTTINALSDQTKQPISRRKILHHTTLNTVVVIPTMMMTTTRTEPANAVKGAAELDLEYYIRDFMGGNPRREGTVGPSSAATTAATAGPPRRLSGPLIPLLLNNDCTPSCIPVQALIQQIQQSRGGGNQSEETKIAQEIQTKVQILRDKVGKSFYARNPWLEESVVLDQYYFDVTAYALWKTAAELLPNFVHRDQFVRRLGRLLYDAMLQTNQLVVVDTAPALVDGSNSNNNTTSLVQSLPVILQVLDLFQSSNFCKGYKIRQDDSSSSSEDEDPLIFDELDDESLVVSGLSVDCLVSIYEPATLGASLQINGEQSRFGPDLVGTTLAAVWENVADIQSSSWETFFVDPEYRPNPKDYYPNEQVRSS